MPGQKGGLPQKPGARKIERTARLRCRALGTHGVFLHCAPQEDANKVATVRDNRKQCELIGGTYTGPPAPVLGNPVPCSLQPGLRLHRSNNSRKTLPVSE